MKLHPVQLGICAFSDAIFVQDVQDVQEARSSAAPQIGIGAMFLRREMESRQVLNFSCCITCFIAIAQESGKDVGLLSKGSSSQSALPCQVAKQCMHLAWLSHASCFLMFLKRFLMFHLFHSLVFPCCRHLSKQGAWDL